jgi:putative aldouronate transport system permease protein
MVAGQRRLALSSFLGESAYRIVGAAYIIALVAVTLFPIWVVVTRSLLPQSVFLKLSSYPLIPRGLSLEAFARVFALPQIAGAFLRSVWRTVAGTSLSVAVTTLAAYAISRRNLPGRRWILQALVFTLIFWPGLLPTYLMVRTLKMYNTMWALVIPGLVDTFYLLVMKAFFESLSYELEEAAKIDGAGDLQILFRIILPLAIPGILTVGLYIMVGHWNDYFAAMLYLTDPRKRLFNVVLRDMLLAANYNVVMKSIKLEEQVPPQTAKAAFTILAALPMVLIYPFVMKYFTRGMMLGAIKG